MLPRWQEFNLEQAGSVAWRDVAIAADRVALLGPGGEIRICRFTSDQLEWCGVFQDVSDTQLLSFSPSARHLATVANHGRCVRVWSLESGRMVAEWNADPKARRVAACCVNSSGVDLLLVATRRMVLEAYELPSQSLLFRADYEHPLALCITHLSALAADGDTFFVIGYLFSESKDSLYGFSLRKLLSGAQTSPLRQMRGQVAISDYAYRLAVGPCSANETVVFRDPEEDEVPIEDDGDALGDVENFKGLYVRRLTDAALVERIPYDARIQTAARIFGTDAVIAVVCPGRLEIVPRGGGVIEKHDGEAFSLDPAARRAARLTHHGRTLGILKL